MGIAELLAVGLLITAGACIQSTVGFGLGMVAAPTLALLDHRLVPVPLLTLAVFISVTVAWQERKVVDYKQVGWALLGRVPGTVLGAVALATLSAGGLDVIFGSVILGAVALSLIGWRPSVQTPSLLIAGGASGFMATVVSVGGPPMALLYQRARVANLRGTMASYFVVGSVMSLLALGLAGQIDGFTLLATAAMAPCVAIGIVVSRYTKRFLDRGYTRIAVLAISSLSAAALLVRAVA